MPRVQQPFRVMSVALAGWLLLAAGCAGVVTAPAGSKTAAGAPVTFTVSISNARSVSVVGSFNGWSPTANPMQAAGSSGKWIAAITLPAGEHKFMYLIDGQTWLTPPAADEFVDDGYGQINGIVVVR